VIRDAHRVALSALFEAPRREPMTEHAIVFGERRISRFSKERVTKRKDVARVHEDLGAQRRGPSCGGVGRRAPDHDEDLARRELAEPARW